MKVTTWQKLGKEQAPWTVLLCLFTVLIVGSTADGTQGDAKAGAKLFEENCTSCHAINEKVVGPAMRDVHKRLTEKKMIAWVRDSQGLIRSGDKHAIALFKEYNYSMMPAFGDMSDKDCRDIIAYIAAESGKPAVK